MEFQYATYVETLGRMDETIERLKTLRVLDPLNLETSIFLIWHDALSGTRQTPEFKEFPVAFGVVELFRATGEWNDYCQPVGADDFECV